MPPVSPAAAGRYCADAGCGTNITPNATKLDNMDTRIRMDLLSDLRIAANTPTVVAAVQAAHIQASTGRRRAVELLKQGAHAVRSEANGVANRVRNPEFHAVPAVARARPPLRPAVHFWTAPASTMM